MFGRAKTVAETPPSPVRRHVAPQPSSRVPQPQLQVVEPPTRPVIEAVVDSRLADLQSMANSLRSQLQVQQKQIYSDSDIKVQFTEINERLDKLTVEIKTPIKHNVHPADFQELKEAVAEHQKAQGSSLDALAGMVNKHIYTATQNFKHLQDQIDDKNAPAYDHQLATQVKALTNKVDNIIYTETNNYKQLNSISKQVDGLHTRHAALEVAQFWLKATVLQDHVQLYNDRECDHDAGTQLVANDTVLVLGGLNSVNNKGDTVAIVRTVDSDTGQIADYYAVAQAKENSTAVLGKFRF